MLSVKKLSLFALLVAFSVGATTASAQQFIGDTAVSVSISPENPGAFQDTTIILSSFSANLDLADIRWSVRGSTVLSGVGKKTYTFKTGAIGKATTIDITIDVPGVPTITKTISITPLETDLLWEAIDSYVPPFYKGKALLPSEGLVKVVAIPNIKNTGGTLLKPGEFSYAWTRNFNEDPSASGFGKNYFIFRDNYLNDQERVTVNLSTVAGDYRATKNIAITTIAPNVLLYENDLHKGINYRESINEDNYFVVESAGASLVAEPYFFSPKSATSSALSYTWTVNGTDIQQPSIKNIFSVRPEQSGTAELKVAVENATKLFQTASKKIILRLQTQ